MSKEVDLKKDANELTISVTFRHTNSTEALKGYAIEKVTQRAKKYIHEPATAHIILSVEKLDHIAEVHLTGNGIDNFAKASTGDLYSAIDKMVDIMEAQARKHKDKIITKRHKAVDLVAESV